MRKKDNCDSFNKVLQNLKRELIRWNKRNFGKNERNILETRDEFEQIKSKISSVENINREIELTAKLEEFLTREEDTLRQKSREIWLREGEKRSKFFHSSTINRRETKLREIRMT